MRIGERFTMASKNIINPPTEFTVLKDMKPGDEELTLGERKQLAGDFSRQLGALISPVPVPLVPLHPNLRTQSVRERPRILRESTSDWTFTEEETLP